MQKLVVLHHHCYGDLFFYFYKGRFVVNSKRKDLLKHPNSRVIILESKESEMMFDLLMNANDIFKNLRQKAGKEGEISIEEATDIISKFQNTLLKTSKILEIVSESLGYPYNEPIAFARMRINSEKGNRA